MTLLNTIKNLYRAFFLMLSLMLVSYGCSDFEKKEKLQVANTHQISTNEQALKKLPAPDLRAPDFILPDINGREFSLSSHIGKIIVLNYWATFCGPCVKEIPDFIELQNEMKNKKVLFVGISSSSDRKEDISSFAKDNKVNYPLVMDNENLFSEKYQAGFRTVPMTFIINHRGEVAHVIVGSTSKKMLKPLITELTDLSQS